MQILLQKLHFLFMKLSIVETKIKMNMITTIYVFALCTVCALVGGKYFPMILPDVHRIFDRKPFNCRPCFTFHSLWILTGIYTLLIQSTACFMAAIILSFIVFFIVKYIDNQKLIK